MTTAKVAFRRSPTVTETGWVTINRLPALSCSSPPSEGSSLPSSAGAASLSSTGSSLPSATGAASLSSAGAASSSSASAASLSSAGAASSSSAGSASLSSAGAASSSFAGWSNASDATVFTPSAKPVSSSASQPWKALLPMVSSASSALRCTARSHSQFRKASASMVSMLAGSFTISMSSLPAKAR